MHIQFKISDDVGDRLSQEADRRGLSPNVAAKEILTESLEPDQKGNNEDESSDNPASLMTRAAGEFRLFESQLNEKHVREVDGEIQVYFPKAGNWQNSAGEPRTPLGYPKTEDTEVERHGVEKARSRAELRKAVEKAGKR